MVGSSGEYNRMAQFQIERRKIKCRRGNGARIAAWRGDRSGQSLPDRRDRMNKSTRCKPLVPLAGIEPALLAELDFESSASTNSATGACLDPAMGRVAKPAEYSGRAVRVNPRRMIRTLAVIGRYANRRRGALVFLKT